MFTVTQIRELIAEDNLYRFYNSFHWRKLTKQIKVEQNNECQHCKLKGKYTQAYIVHHVNELKINPELAYSKFFFDSQGVKQIQLLCLCHDCHEKAHAGRFGNENKQRFENTERW